MKKNVIRLTEAELKQYIGKVVKEQTATPAEAAQVNKAKVSALTDALVGQRPQLYMDFQKSQKSHVVSIENVGISTTNVGVFYFYVKDLAFVTASGAPQTPQDTMGEIKTLTFSCMSPDRLVAAGEGKNLGPVFCPPMTDIAKKAAGCTTIDKTPTLASAGSGVQSTMAEIQVNPTLS